MEAVRFQQNQFSLQTFWRSGVKEDFKERDNECRCRRMDSDNSNSFRLGSRIPPSIGEVFITGKEKPPGFEGHLVYRSIFYSLGNLGHILVLASEEVDDVDIEIFIDKKSKLRSGQEG